MEGRRSSPELRPVLGAKGDRFHSAVISPADGVGCTDVQLPSLPVQVFGLFANDTQEAGSESCPKTRNKVVLWELDLAPVSCQQKAWPHC